MTNRPAITWRKRGTGLPPKRYGPAHTADPAGVTQFGSRAYCGTWFPHGQDKLWTNAAPDDRKCRECERGAAAAGEPAGGEPDVTAAIRRAAEVAYAKRPPYNGRLDFDTARAELTAALNGPNDQYGVMDDVTIAVHAALCEDSPEDCVAWRGACVRAVEAVRTTITGALPTPY